ncbi:hypothetical protein WJX72_003303 [[Myrmecia] bisecta]|uniref:Ubiquitin-like domain-containing protein n=1 Tax=[Myrmecia] bisecta TaxID=41462 RepID=A0AAW1QPP6_9CHLO
MSDSTERLKLMFQQKSGSPIDEIALEYGGRWLMGGLPLSAYGVSAGATIHQRGRLRGGAPGGASKSGAPADMDVAATPPVFNPGGIGASTQISSAAHVNPMEFHMFEVDSEGDNTWTEFTLNPSVPSAGTLKVIAVVPDNEHCDV